MCKFTRRSAVGCSDWLGLFLIAGDIGDKLTVGLSKRPGPIMMRVTGSSTDHRPANDEAIVFPIWRHHDRHFLRIRVIVASWVRVGGVCRYLIPPLQHTREDLLPIFCRRICFRKDLQKWNKAIRTPNEVIQDNRVLRSAAELRKR